jgi:uracil-DNA glycosylase family 4
MVGNNMDYKTLAYDRLVESRGKCHLCKGLCNPAKVKGYDKFDTEIGPWSKWQGNLDADLMIVGQDWGLQKDLEEWGARKKHKGMYQYRSYATNRHLQELLDETLGIKIEWELRGRGGELYFTNAVLCIRKDSFQAQARPDPSWFHNCVEKKKFLKKQIEIVNPKVVVGLGRRAFESILSSFGLEAKFPPSMKLKEIVQENGIKIPGTRAKAFAVYHCGAAGWNINRIQEHSRDWKRICECLYG